MAPCSRGSSLAFASLLIWASLLLGCVRAETSRVYIYGTDHLGVTRRLPVDRSPALHSGDFADCSEGGESSSLFRISRFDTAFYRDNRTVLFHLHGTPKTASTDDLRVDFSLQSYGRISYETSFEPCGANITTMCPPGPEVPFRVWSAFTLSPEQVGRVPDMAYNMPDFEGFARVQLFSMISGREVGCFQATLTNDRSFSQPLILAPIMGGFALAAVLASFFSAAYGVSIPHMRMHHAHSLPVLLVFEAFQSVFLTGALSVDWPTNLMAWWSNFAWSAGMIYAPSVTGSIDSFAGNSGGASGISALQPTIWSVGETGFSRREPYDANNPYDYKWGGKPVGLGLPLPGSTYGFPATLAGAQIPAANAFAVGLIWFTVVLGATALFAPAMKLLLECLVRVKCINKDRLSYFRGHYLGFTAHAVLRAMFIAFFLISTLATFQFALGGPAGVIALAAVVLVLFVVLVGGGAAYACYSRLRFGKFSVDSDAVVLQPRKLFDTIPCVLPTRSSTLKHHCVDRSSRPILSIPFFRVRHIDDNPDRPTVHLDQPFVKKFGWLTARYRRTRWWFSAVHVGYQLVRAAFLGGAARTPLVQVYGLFAVEVLAFVVTASLRPYESTRNNALGVWMLGIAKVATTGLSIALLPDHGLSRRSATVLGTIIIVIQALLVLGVLALVLLSVLSTCMSMARNRVKFSPEELDFRSDYFESMQTKADDEAVRHDSSGEDDAMHSEGKKPIKSSSDSFSPPSTQGAGGGTGAGGGVRRGQRASRTFSVTSVRRNPKIEDEHADVLAEMERQQPSTGGGGGGGPGRLPQRTSSIISARMSSSSLRGTPRRTSWSSRDFAVWDASMTSLEQLQQQQGRTDSGSFNKRLSPAIRTSAASSVAAAVAGGGGAPGRLAPIPSEEKENAAAATATSPTSPPFVTPPTSPPAHTPRSPLSHTLERLTGEQT